MLLLSTRTNNKIVLTDERTDGRCVKLYFLSLLTKFLAPKELNIFFLLILLDGNF